MHHRPLRIALILGLLALSGPADGVAPAAPPPHEAPQATPLALSHAPRLLAQAAAPSAAPAETAAPPADGGPAAPTVTRGGALIRKLVAGGWTMIALLAVSVVGVSVFVERLIRLRRRAIAPTRLAEDADRLWRSQQFDALQKRAQADPSTLGRVVAAMVRHRRSPHADVDRIAGDIASRDLRRHLQKAYPLLVVATLAPLLGLLGTVIGMVGAFSTIEALGELANPAAFGGDISKALITTGAGLTIAVPALAAYHYFKARTLALGVELEEIASELLTDWFISHPDPTPPVRAGNAGQPEEPRHAG